MSRTRHGVQSALVRLRELREGKWGALSADVERVVDAAVRDLHSAEDGVADLERQLERSLARRTR